MSKSNLNVADSSGKTMTTITEDAIKYKCIKPYVSSVPEKGHRETEQTQNCRLIRDYTVCLQEIIFEIESR